MNELFDQARLADAGLGDDGDETARVVTSRGRELVSEDRKFACASYEWAVVLAFDTFRLPCGDEAVGRYALCFPFQLEGLDWLDFDCMPDQTVGRLADEHLARRSGLLEACGRVDRVAGYESLPGRHVAGDDLAGVDACAVADRDTPALIELFVEHGETLTHLDGGSDCAEGVVLVDAGEAEDGHDRIADVFLDCSPV